jgi:hypothetical protein
MPQYLLKRIGTNRTERQGDDGDLKPASFARFYHLGLNLSAANLDQPCQVLPAPVKHLNLITRLQA